MLLAANLALLVLFFAALRQWLAEEPAWKRPTLIGLALAAAWTVLLLGFFEVPARLLTPLQEGTGRTNLLQLYGTAAHAGPNYTAWTRLWTPGGPAAVAAIVRANLWLSGVDCVLYLLLAWRVLGGWWPAMFLAAFFAGNRSWANAALSEAPTALLTFYFFSAFLGGALFWRRMTRVPLALLALACLLAALTRVEMAGPGAAAAGLCLLRLSLYRDSPDFASRWLRSVLDWSVLEKVLLLILLAGLSLRQWEGTGRETWVLEGLRPLNPSFLLLPIVLLHFLPLGLVLLCLAGLAHSLRRVGGFLALPVSLLVLFRTYHAAAVSGGGGYCDMFRLFTPLTPMALTLALFGWREMSRLLPHRAAAALLGALFLVPWGGPMLRFYPDGNQGRPWLWDGLNQKEVRYLSAALEREPDAVFVTRVLAGRQPRGSMPAYQWAFFGRPLPSLMFDEDGAKSLARVVSEMGWTSRKVLFYNGLDCNLAGESRPCVEGTAGLRALDGVVFEDPFFCDPSEHCSHTAAVALGIFEFSGPRGIKTVCPKGGSVPDWLAMAYGPSGLAALGCAKASSPRPESLAEIARAEIRLSGK